MYHCHAFTVLQCVNKDIIYKIVERFQICQQPEIPALFIWLTF